ncbi:substrate-binding domain-containing protein [Coraliomargarita sinensis]|nr:substrate-binding domain-containing protein [Coraliomargarita sinensis]
MKKQPIKTASEQVADLLHEQIMRRTWTETMPGVQCLVKELQVGFQTVKSALGQLENEGLLVPQGQGKRRRIVLPDADRPLETFRIRILPYAKEDRKSPDNAEILIRLLEAGVNIAYAEKSMQDFGMRVDRVARYVKSHPADAWITSAASREINQWFSEQAFPALAINGRTSGLSIASAHNVFIPSLREAIKVLIARGHKRIVMFARRERRKPVPSKPEQAFLDELKAAGIQTGEYNLPEWVETREGLHRLLNELFRLSSPTALIFQETAIFTAARAHISKLGYHAPHDISLLVGESDPSFAWCDPAPAHFHLDYDPLVRRAVRWARNVASGKNDLRQVGFKAKFFEGGTIGPVR